MGAVSGLQSLMAVLAPVLEDFVPRCPEVRLHIVEGYSGSLTDMVLDEELDFAVVPAFEGTIGLKSRLLVRDRERPDVVVHPLSPRDTAMVFIEHGFRIELRDGAALTREMDTACDAAARVPAWRLSYPRDEGQWDRVARVIAAHVRDTVANPCCS